MSKALLIAEKPSVSRDIESVYKKMAAMEMRIDFAAAAGHLMALDEPEKYYAAWGNRWRKDILPIFPKKMRYHVAEGNEKLFNSLKQKLLSDYDYIINACDAGREGELIFSTLYDYVGCKTPVLRFWAQDNSDTGIQRALENMFDAAEKKNLKNAAYLRQWQDNLEGINFSRAVSISAHKGYNIGRVMTAVTAMVVQRCREHDDFKPEPFYECVLRLVTEDGEGFDAKVFTEQDGKMSTHFQSEDTLKKLLADGTSEGTVVSVDAKKQTEYAPHLYNLTHLQMDASTMAGFDPTKTLQIAQKLYEKKLLSYPRSESMHLSQGLAADIVSHIRPVGSIPGLGSSVEHIMQDDSLIRSVMQDKRYVDDSKLTDHYALIPTDVVPDFTCLSREEQIVYTLVAKRFLAIFFPPFITEKQQVICDFGGLKAATSGKAVVQQGYRTLYKKEEGKYIPAMSAGDPLIVVDVGMTKGKTTPPKYYTEASLLEAMLNVGQRMEEDAYKDIFKKTKGIGTVATRAGIIKKLIDRDRYLEIKGKGNIVATDKAYALVDLLDGHPIIMPELTAKRELALLDVEEGRMDANAYYLDMRRSVIEETRRLLAMAGCPQGGKRQTGSTGHRKTAVGADEKPADKQPDESKKTLTRDTEASDGMVRAESLQQDIPQNTGLQAQETAGTGLPDKTETEVSPSEGAQPETAQKAKQQILARADCPLCGQKLIISDNYYRCAHYKKAPYNCKFIIQRNYKGVFMTDDIVAELLSGDFVRVKQNTKNGKQRNMTMYYEDGEIVFV